MRNSGVSSRNRTPPWASETSPGRCMRPPPISPSSDALWCGVRNGARVISDAPAPRVPATECTRVTSSACLPVSGGRMPGRRRAAMVLPLPGGPNSSAWWRPAAAISSARFSRSWPRRSAKSPSAATAAGASAEASLRRRGAAGHVSGRASRSVLTAWASESTPTIAPRPSACASARLVRGTTKRSMPRSSPVPTAASTPCTGRTSPRRVSSPSTMIPTSSSQGT